MRRERVILKPGRPETNPPCEGVQLLEVGGIRRHVAGAEPERAPALGCTRSSSTMIIEKYPERPEGSSGGPARTHSRRPRA